MPPEPGNEAYVKLLEGVDFATYHQSSGPERKPALPITYWFPAWWGISPWASPFWKTYAR